MLTQSQAPVAQSHAAAEPETRHSGTTALVGAFLLAFTFSWDEFLIAWFHSGFESTLPVVIWSMVRAAISPEINAIGALVFLTSVILVSTGYFIALAPSRRRTAVSARNAALNDNAS